MKSLFLIGAAALIPCTAAVLHDSPNDHRAVLEAWVDMWQRRDLDIADRVLAPDLVRFHPRDELVRDREGFKALLTHVTTAFPDFAVEVHGIDVDARGGRIRWTVTGTHTGPGEGPPTGRKVELTGSDAFDIEDGRITRNWAGWDRNEFIAQLGAPRRPPQPYQNLQVMRGWIELANGGDLDRVDDLFADDHVLDENGTRFEGPAAMRQHIARVREAFAGFHLEPQHEHAAGDLCSTRWTATGKHTGEFLGIPATGRKIEVHGLTLTRCRDGKMVESFLSWDTNVLLRQLGVAPGPGPGK
ncbi:MAG: ester cyclase [Planctomycetes bacterium]|nr:ester cyclase [Planctomycetota bacterium]